MKIRVLFLIALFTLALGCNKENDFTTAEKDQVVTTTEKASNPVTKPFKVNKSYGPYALIPGGGECGDFPLTLVYITGEGNATHLGKFTCTLTYCIDLYTEIVTSPHYGVIIATNGDELYIFIETPWDGESVYVEDGITYYVYTFEGGTGRFENATGTLTYWGPTYPDPGGLTGTWYLEAKAKLPINDFYIKLAEGGRKSSFFYSIKLTPNQFFRVEWVGIFFKPPSRLFYGINVL